MSDAAKKITVRLAKLGDEQLSFSLDRNQDIQGLSENDAAGERRLQAIALRPWLSSLRERATDA